MNKPTDSSSIHDYSAAEDESINDDFAEFSPKLQFYKVYRTCLTLTGNNQYPLARKTLYDSLGWFQVLFDETFTRRCDLINKKYASIEHHSLYTPEQLEQLKYIRTVVEFTRLLIDVSSKNKVKINTDPSRRVELIPRGYSQIIYYDRMATDFFVKLNQVQKLKPFREVLKFFNHSICWFGGIFDAHFISMGYLISKTVNQSPETKYRRMVGEFSKLLTRKSIAPAPFVTLAYKPRPSHQIPRSVRDVVKVRKPEVKLEPEAPEEPEVTLHDNFKDILDF